MVLGQTSRPAGAVTSPCWKSRPLVRRLLHLISAARLTCRSLSCLSMSYSACQGRLSSSEVPALVRPSAAPVWAFTKPERRGQGAGTANSTRRSGEVTVPEGPNRSATSRTGDTAPARSSGSRFVKGGECRC